MSGQDDELVKVSPLLEIIKDWQTFLAIGITDKKAEEIRRHEHTGRPLGNEPFMEELEKTLNRALRRQKQDPNRINRGDKYGVPGIQRIKD